MIIDRNNFQFIATTLLVIRAPPLIRAPLPDSENFDELIRPPLELSELKNLELIRPPLWTPTEPFKKHSKIAILQAKAPQARKF